MPQLKYLIDDIIIMQPEFENLGFSIYGKILGVFPNEIDQYLVQFSCYPENSSNYLRRVNEASIFGLSDGAGD